MDQGRDGQAAELLVGVTKREGEVLSLICEGLGTRAIAMRLAISSSTVRNHVQNMLQRLGLHSRLQLAAWSRQSQNGASSPSRQEMQLPITRSNGGSAATLPRIVHVKLPLTLILQIARDQEGGVDASVVKVRYNRR